MGPESSKIMRIEEEQINVPEIIELPQKKIKIENKNLKLVEYRENTKVRPVLSRNEARKKIDEAKSIRELRKAIYEIGVLKGEQDYSSDQLIKILKNFEQRKSVTVPKDAGLSDKAQELAFKKFKEELIKNPDKLLKESNVINNTQ